MNNNMHSNEPTIKFCLRVVSVTYGHDSIESRLLGMPCCYLRLHVDVCVVTQSKAPLSLEDYLLVRVSDKFIFLLVVMWHCMSLAGH